MNKRIFLLKTCFCIGILSGVILISAVVFSQTKPAGMDQTVIDKVRAEVKATPTNEKNILTRWKTLKTWVPILLGQCGAQRVDTVLPREKFFTLDGLIENKNYREAAPLIDEVFAGFEKLLYKDEKKKPTGSVYGKVTDSSGEPIKGVTVTLFGTQISAKTDKSGSYRIQNIPVASPRYILTAKKEGFFEGQIGNINAVSGQPTVINFILQKETPQYSYLKEKLAVKIGYVIEVKPTDKIPNPAPNAILAPSLYPDKIMPYLKAGKDIESNNPQICGLASEILKKIPLENRTKETVVAKAVYDWVVRNIDYDLMKNFPGDITCGNWQTTYGGWGRSFSDWCYSPVDTLREKRAICIEYERLTTTLLRALEIPARPAPLKAHPVTQWWVQLPDGSGYWSNMETSMGHTIYSEKGDIWAKFPAVPDSAIAFYPIDENAPIHIDWWTDSPCIWLEDYGEHNNYDYADNALKEAQNALDEFAKGGKIPPGEKGTALPQPGIMQKPHYEVYSRGLVIDLASIGNQKTLVVKFPVFPDNNYQKVLRMEHWTNMQDWFFRRYLREEINPDTGERLSWYCVEFRW